MYQLIDFVNPTETYGLTEKLEKINFNIEQVATFKRSIEDQRRMSRNAFTCMSVFGRWIVIYSANVNDDNNTLMHFIDFRLDIDSLPPIFSVNTINGIKQIQNQYDKVFSTKLDNVELNAAEIYERVLRHNLFTCDIDEKVLVKAQELGVLPIIETLNEGDFVKVTVVDEKSKMSDRQITNLYALFHFGGHGQGEEHENGFTYVKLHDLLNNISLLDEFELIVKRAGGEYTRSYLIDRFVSAQSN